MGRHSHKVLSRFRYMSSRAKILIRAKRGNALPYVFYPPIFSLRRPFSRFSPRATSKAVEDGERPPTNAMSPQRGERNISSFPPLFASISTSSTKIEMRGNWKMESTLSEDSFVPFVGGFQLKMDSSLKIRPRMAMKYDVNSTRERDKIARRQNADDRRRSIISLRQVFVIELIFRALNISAESFRGL